MRTPNPDTGTNEQKHSALCDTPYTYPIIFTMKLVQVILFIFYFYYGHAFDSPYTFRKRNSTMNRCGMAIPVKSVPSELNMVATIANSDHSGHPKEESFLRSRRPLGRFLTSFFRCIFWVVGWWVVKWRNTTFVHDEHNIRRHFLEKKDDMGIITFSNHISIFDDPGIWIGMFRFKTLTLKFLRSIVMEESWYWSKGKFSASIFRGLNCIPIKRGDIRALECPALREMHTRLNGKDEQNGNIREHVHLMIEGKINQHWRFVSKSPRFGKFRKGTAKLILSSPPKQTLVIPIYHTGLDQVFPEQKPEGYQQNDRLVGTTKSFWPKKGKRIDIYIGDPIDFSDIVPNDGYQFDQTIEKTLLDDINKKLYESMLQLDNKAKEREERERSDA
jgi:1-acyl-sn-glycerol-3-phosphate acyltransferase